MQVYGVMNSHDLTVTSQKDYTTFPLPIQLEVSFTVESNLDLFVKKTSTQSTGNGKHDTLRP
jgi:hypothetical protein